MPTRTRIALSVAAEIARELMPIVEEKKIFLDLGPAHSKLFKGGLQLSWKSKKETKTVDC